MLQRIKSAFEVTGRTRIRNVLAITWRRCYNVSGTCCWECRPKNAITPRTPQDQDRHWRYMKKMLQRIKSVMEVTWRTCSNVSGTSWPLLEEDVTMYQERVAENADKRTLSPPPTSPNKRYAMCKSDNCPAPPWAPPPKTCTKNRLVPCLYTQLIGWIWWCHKFRGPLQWVARVCRLTRFWIWLRCRLLGQMRDLIPKTCKG